MMPAAVDRFPDLPPGRRPFGWELTIDLAGGNPDILDDADRVAEWCRKLVTVIDMEPYGDPIVARFGVGDLEGITAIQRITTSSLTIHCDPPDGAYVNVFSCRRFDPRVATDFTLLYFEARAATATFVVRRAPAVDAGFTFGFNHPDEPHQS